MSEHLKIISTKDLKGRAAAAGLIAAAVLFAVFAVKWQIGNMLGALTPASEPNARSVAALARSLSPRDPITNWLAASVEKESFADVALARAVLAMEETVRLAPADYRYWVELARAYEQQEQFEKSEKAFRRAIELAPNYSNVRWHFGNFLLRRGREPEAFAELRRTAETSVVYREQVFSVVWEYYDKDTARLERLAEAQSEMRAGLAKFYAVKERPEDSLRVWNMLSDDEKQRNQAVARLVAQALYDKRFYRAAVEFVRQLGIEPQAQADALQNGGFESVISTEPRENFFAWQAARREKMEINTDSFKKKEGSRSLRLSFNGFTGVELKNLQQLVVVAPGAKYRLSYWVRTENLKSAGPPNFEIVNANDEKIVTTGAPFPAGTQDWTPQTVEFTAPATAQAVALRLDRAYCGDACPIAGTVWLDDVRLERLN